MRLKRALMFAILMATLGSTYYFYTLHFKLHSANDELAKNNAAFRGGNSVFHVRAKDSESHKDSPPVAFQLHSERLKTDGEEHHDPQMFQLFPKGVGEKKKPIDQTEEVNKELEPGNEPPDRTREPTTVPTELPNIEDGESDTGDNELGVETPAYDKGVQSPQPSADTNAKQSESALDTGGAPKDNAAKEDAAKREWANRMQEQQRLIEKQAQMLKQFQEHFQAQQQQQPLHAQQQIYAHRQEPLERQQQTSNLNPQQDSFQSQQRHPTKSFDQHQKQILNQGQPQGQDQIQQESSSQDEQQSQDQGQQQLKMQSSDHETAQSLSTTIDQYNADQDLNALSDKPIYQAGYSNSLLDRVENFNGEIKGRFNGLIFKDDNPPAQLAVNGVQPRQKPILNRQDDVFNQDQPGQQKQTIDAAKMFEQARQKGNVFSGSQLTQQFRSPQEQGQILTTIAQSAEHVRDAAKMFEEAGQRNQAKQNMLQNPDGQQSDSNDNSNNDEQPQNENSDPSMIGREGKVHRELTPLEEQSPINEGGANRGLPKYLPRQAPPNNDRNPNAVTTGTGKNADASVENLESQVEQKIHNDPLLEDRFKQMKNDFEGDVRPGVEPKIQPKPDTHSNGIGTEDHNDESKAAVPGKPPSDLIATVYDLTQKAEGAFQCVALRLRVFSRTLCVYPQHTDTGASKQIIQRGTWEERELEEFEAALNTDPSLGAVDLGAGLGVYTLAAASKDRPVVAVEPFKENIRLFHKTMQLNTVTDKVTLITDALGEKVGVGRLRYPQPSGNMGAAYVDPVKLSDVGPGDTDLVRIVRLDDVIPAVTFQRAVVKLDVQGDESKVLKGARRFFSQINVQFLFMHWIPSQDKLQFKMTESFLRQYGMEPAKSVKDNILYSDSDLTDDINFIVWRKIGVAKP
ncbi:hypothetical protein V1264_023352 [Littorina saxatilis]